MNKKQGQVEELGSTQSGGMGQKVLVRERDGLAWVSGVSGGKGERWKRKRERAEGEKRLTQMLLLEPSTPHTAWFDSIQKELERAL